MELFELNQNWRFREEGASEWQPAAVPGCVHTDLLKNRLIPDPFYRDNEKKLQWIEAKNWEYETEFLISAKQLGRENLDLIFNGLDTYAEVFLNEKPVLSTNNMFREWRVPVKAFLREGRNVLRILFRSPTRKIAPRLKNLSYILPSAHDRESKTSPYTRKAPYQFGWDWGPRFVTMGIWRPVFLEMWEGARISDLWLRQKELSEERAILTAQLEIQASTGGVFEIVVGSPKNLFGPVRKSTKIEAGTHFYQIDFTIQKPTLWWPNGMGEQYLYDVAVTLEKEARPLGRASRRIGLRTLELRREKDQWGESFAFVVNGKPVFAKGGNWIPADSFPSRVSEEKYRQLLQSVRDAHMNMIRVWGGGIYEEDIFYDLCDEMGLLVWQDFMFACSFYPGDEEFLENVKMEAEGQVKRLRNHPSLALWCGNNEIEASWAEWGWKKGAPAEVWDNYLKLFQELLPQVCRNLDPDRPYWPSSPSSNLQATPSSPEMGDVHFWDVWHKGKPFEAYREVKPRFVSEYGFQSFPEKATVEAFSIPDDWQIDSPVMLAHQKDSGGNQRILNYLHLYYNEPKDFVSFLYMSQILQAQGIKMGAEHFRRLHPRCMGSLYWQINDCWPVASWSSLDYFGRWKALHFYARRFYSPVLVSPVETDGRVQVFVISDELEEVKATLAVNLFSLEGKILWKTDMPVRIPAGSSQLYFEISRTELLRNHNPEKVVLWAGLFSGETKISENALFFAPPKKLALQNRAIRVEIGHEAEGFSLHLSADYFAKDVFLTAEGIAGRFNDNFFDLLPGNPRTIYFFPDKKIATGEFREKLQIKSLIDAF